MRQRFFNQVHIVSITELLLPCRDASQSVTGNGEFPQYNFYGQTPWQDFLSSNPLHLTYNPGQIC